MDPRSRKLAQSHDDHSVSDIKPPSPEPADEPISSPLRSPKRRDFEGFLSRQQAVVERRIAHVPPPEPAPPRAICAESVKIVERKRAKSSQTSQSEVAEEPLESASSVVSRKREPSEFSMADNDVRGVVRKMRKDATLARAEAQAVRECTFSPKFVTPDSDRQITEERRKAMNDAKQAKMENLRQEQAEKREVPPVGEFHYCHKIPKRSQQIFDMLGHGNDPTKEPN
jgi:hypothetical protein